MHRQALVERDFKLTRFPPFFFFTGATAVAAVLAPGMLLSASTAIKIHTVLQDTPSDRFERPTSSRPSTCILISDGPALQLSDGAVTTFLPDLVMGCNCGSGFPLVLVGYEIVQVNEGVEPVEIMHFPPRKYFEGTERVAPESGSYSTFRRSE